MKDKYFYCIDSSDNYGESLEQVLLKLKEEVKIRKMVGEDVFTSVCRRIAYKNISFISGLKEKTGLIFATEYGNLTSMIEMCKTAADGNYVSTKMFPNALISSASSATSLLLETKGLNLTINSGYFGYVTALELASMYIDSGELDTCIIMSGDYYNEFSQKDIMQLFTDVSECNSKVTLSVISANNTFDNAYTLAGIDQIDCNEDLMRVYFGDLLWSTNCDVKADEICNKYSSSSFTYDLLYQSMRTNSNIVNVEVARRNGIGYRLVFRRCNEEAVVL